MLKYGFSDFNSRGYLVRNRLAVYKYFMIFLLRISEQDIDYVEFWRIYYFQDNNLANFSVCIKTRKRFLMTVIN